MLRIPFVIVCLLTIYGTLWSQPDFRWPVDMANVDTLGGNLGEPRAQNPYFPHINPLDHWHKGIDIPKTNGDSIRIPAVGKITYISDEDSSIVVLHHGVDGGPVGWHTRFLHVDFNDKWSIGDILRLQADGKMPVLGEVTEGHCHFEVYQFDTEQNGSLYGNLGYVRNPLNYDNLDSGFPDNDDPTVAGIRFSLSNRWDENWDENHFDNVLQTLDDGQERFLPPVEGQKYPDIYFLAHAYDDITPSGATGPYSVEFSICKQDCNWDKIYSFKYQFDDLQDADGADLQLMEVYANGTQANNRMFYFSKKINLFDIPLNVDEAGFVIVNPESNSLNLSREWQTLRFQVDVTDKKGKRNSTYKDISVPPDPSHAFSDILVDSFSTKWQENYVHIDFRVFDSEKVKGFNILRRSADESTFAPVHPYPLTIHPTSEPVDPWQSSSTLLSYEDGGLVPGETYFYALEVLWQSGRRDILEHLVTKVCVPDGGHITQQSQQSQKEIL